MPYKDNAIKVSKMIDNHIQVQKLKTTDKQEIIQFWSEAFPDDPPHNAPEKMLKAKLEVDDLVFVAKNNQQIIGACMAGYDGHRGWLYAVAVNPAYQRQGIGNKLVNSAISALKEKGCIKLNLQIRADNTQVANFYRALGFEVEERLSMGCFI